MLELKQPKTFEEQVAILKQHGCVIDDEETCIRVLANVNYYRLSAYFLPFKEKNSRYHKGTTFNQIYQIYEFDRKLRNLLFGALEAIEISLKTRLAYLHGHQYGPLGYLDPKHFNKHHDSDRFVNLINSEISRNEKLLFVKHHKEKYDGRFPIWVITELFSFGMTSYFYADLHTIDKKAISKQYGVNYQNLQSWLRCLTDLRNICAHHGRLYYRVFSASPRALAIPERSKRRLWGIMLTLKSVYPSSAKWELEILPELRSLFTEYSPYIDLYHLAFPGDWFDQLSLI